MGQKRRLEAAKNGTVTFETQKIYKEWVLEDLELSKSLANAAKAEKSAEREMKEKARKMDFAKRGRVDREELGEEDNFEIV